MSNRRDAGGHVSKQGVGYGGGRGGRTARVEGTWEQRWSELVDMIWACSC